MKSSKVDLRIDLQDIRTQHSFGFHMIDMFWSWCTGPKSTCLESIQHIVVATSQGFPKTASIDRKIQCNEDRFVYT